MEIICRFEQIDIFLFRVSSKKKAKGGNWPEERDCAQSIVICDRKALPPIIWKNISKEKIDMIE
jgi:hypothetical protein